MENKQKRKWNDTIIVLYIITFVMIFAGQILGTLVNLIPVQNPSDAFVTARMYLAFIGIWALFLLYMGITKKNRPILVQLTHKVRGNNWKNLLLGILIGFGMNAFCALAAYLHKDIVLTFDSFHPAEYSLWSSK